MTKHTKLTHVFGDVVRVFDANSNSETTDWEPKDQQPNHPVKAIEKSGFNDFVRVLKTVKFVLWQIFPSKFTFAATKAAENGIMNKDIWTFRIHIEMGDDFL